MRCSWCRTEGARWAQFSFMHASACDACMNEHEGWRREDGRPLTPIFPQDDIESQTFGYVACFMFSPTQPGHVCRKPQGHEGDC